MSKKRQFLAVKPPELYQTEHKLQIFSKTLIPNAELQLDLGFSNVVHKAKLRPRPCGPTMSKTQESGLGLTQKGDNGDFCPKIFTFLDEEFDEGFIFAIKHDLIL